MAYLSAAKIAEIKSKFKHTLNRFSLNYLLTELAAMEASIAAGGGIDWGELADISSVGTKAAGTSVEFARADHAHDIAANAVTGPKLNKSAFFSGHFAGVAAAGPVALVGAKVGDQVLMLTNLTDAGDGSASFESTITVADQIQQSSASDLHLKNFSVLLLVKS